MSVVLVSVSVPSRSVACTGAGGSVVVGASVPGVNGGAVSDTEVSVGTVDAEVDVVDEPVLEIPAVAIPEGNLLDTGAGDEARGADAIAVFGAAQYNGHPSPVYHARLEHAVNSVRPLVRMVRDKVWLTLEFTKPSNASRRLNLRFSRIRSNTTIVSIME